MGISIGGVKVTSLNITLDEKGTTSISGGYNIVTKNNTVLAKQNFNTYSDTVKIMASGDLGEVVNQAMTKTETRISKQLFGDEEL